MRTRSFYPFFLSISLSLMFHSVSGQVPQGVNYQAIARDASGNPIVGATLEVRMGILSDTITPVIVREELFTPVRTNAFGMFTVILGTGTYQSGSTFNFSDIDWISKPLYLRTFINYPIGSWKYMGSYKLWAVPYSQVAKRLGGPVPGLKVRGTESSMDSALFEVRNKDGLIVFAVYNEGVRVYVDDGIAGKGNKGGFAIGSFNTAKNPSQTLMMVRPDTFRIYFDDTPGKATKGGFAIGGFNTSKGNGPEYLSVKGTTPDIIIPSQARILWYPLKEAFLTGRVRVASPDSVGLNSISTGFESRASGNYSQAFGYKSVAKGYFSSAFGRYSYAGDTSSYSFGDHSRATGVGSYALGTNALASGPLSIAIGSITKDSTGKYTASTIASGFGSFAAGFGSVASAQGSIAIGVNDTASGLFASAIGYQTVANGWYATALGYKTHAGGFLCSTATGWQDTVQFWGWGGMANNVLTKVGGWAGASFGDRTYALGHTSFATGYRTLANGHLSATFGDQTKASGDGAIALGHSTTAQAYGSLAIGRFNMISGDSVSWLNGDPLFIAGNGSSKTTRSNAFTIYKNGITDVGSYINLCTQTTDDRALMVNNHEALWYNNNYFSWGFGSNYNAFWRPVIIGGADNPSPFYLVVYGDAWSSGSFYNGSDIRWKKDILPLENVLRSITRLNGYHFTWRSADYPEKNFEEGPQIGLIAQEVEKVFPEIVRTDKEGYMAVSYEKMTTILLQGMKEQQLLIEKQQAENHKLRSELEAVKSDVDKLRTQIERKHRK